MKNEQTKVICDHAGKCKDKLCSHHKQHNPEFLSDYNAEGKIVRTLCSKCSEYCTTAKREITCVEVKPS